MNCTNTIPPFDPRIYTERGYDFYDDGRVNATIDVTQGGEGLEINEWFCAYPGNGCTTEALRWLREQGYTYLVAVQVTEEALDYWHHMRSLGLIDAMTDQSGNEIPNSVPAESKVDIDGGDTVERPRSADRVENDESPSFEM